MTKRCSECGETKPLSCFGKRSDRPSGYRSHCNACGSARKSKWYSENQSHVKDYYAKWRAENPGLAETYTKRWKENNAERVREMKREWARKNPDSVRAMSARNRARNGDGKARRRARLREVAHEKIVPARVYERDRWICAICGKKVNRKLKGPHPQSASIDHIVPVSLGGEHTYINVQLAHYSCNSSKGNRRAGDQLAMFGGIS
jgi:5-methylcytosine-specific restriction endonuclease McrA